MSETLFLPSRNLHGETEIYRSATAGRIHQVLEERFCNSKYQEGFITRAGLELFLKDQISFERAEKGKRSITTNKAMKQTDGSVRSSAWDQKHAHQGVVSWLRG